MANHKKEKTEQTEGLQIDMMDVKALLSERDMQILGLRATIRRLQEINEKLERENDQMRTDLERRGNLKSITKDEK